MKNGLHFLLARALLPGPSVIDPGFGTATTTSTQQVSNLVIDLFDAGSKSLLWRGLATADLSTNASRNTNSLNNDIAKMFKGFPPKPDK